MEYCGFRTSNVKASRKGSDNKSRKSHSRRNCYKTRDAGLNDSEHCRVSDNDRCVVQSKDNSRADELRAVARSRSSSRRNERRAYLGYLPRGEQPKGEQPRREVLSKKRVEEPRRVEAHRRVEEPRRVEAPRRVEERVETPVVSPRTPVEESPRTPSTPSTPSTPKRSPIRSPRKLSPSSGLGDGPYVFNFVVDTRFNERSVGGKKPITVENQIKAFYRSLLKEHSTVRAYENIDQFTIKQVDDNEYQGSLTLKDTVASVKDVEEIINDILDPSFIMKTANIPVFSEYLEDTLELNGKKLNQAGGRRRRFYYRK